MRPPICQHCRRNTGWYGGLCNDCRERFIRRVVLSVHEVAKRDHRMTHKDRRHWLFRQRDQEEET